ncbi:MAG: M1 family metallopeptidase [Bernardetiaceae bacterium]|nr:M1 family metallopeptidase [Bernardetiaceae bacterium]
MQKLALFLLGIILLSSCNTESNQNDSEKTESQQKTEELMPISQDPHSYARPQEAVITHLKLSLEVDFEQKLLNGIADFDIENKKSVDKIYLDIDGIEIQEVTADGEPTEYELGKPDTHLGQALAVLITPQTKRIRITYQTAPDAKALQWLDSEQTQGKKKPFLFTQSQAILARTWVPVQDSPGIRFTYEATVTVPKDLLALMSAENPKEKNEEGVYHFRMPQPIPAYLLALAVGDLAFEALGERTGVYAEPALLAKAANEFAETEKMLLVAEEMYGTYRWGRYDLLVLPPSFPFGGMENPRLTFATPTILAGDRSLTALVAHELAHSWSGNLVTNATWNDLWLNEGFTVYFENRIMEKIYGKDYADMLALISYLDLKAEVEERIESNPKDTHLKLDLLGRNPDDGVSSIAYDKGFFFLKRLEEMVGREQLDEFLSTYFNHFAFKTIDTEQFLEYLHKNMLDSLSDAQRGKIDITEWVYRKGIPNSLPRIQSERYDEAIAAAALFKEKNELPTKQQVGKWKYQQWEFFLRELPDTLSDEQLQTLDKTFKLSESGNNEILFQWLLHVARNEYKPAYPQMRTFLTTVGRRKFLSPIYKVLLANPKTKNLATEIFEEAKPNYHSVSRNSIQGMILEVQNN